MRNIILCVGNDTIPRSLSCALISRQFVKNFNHQFSFLMHGEILVMRKIIRIASKIALRFQDEFHLGNIGQEVIAVAILLGLLHRSEKKLDWKIENSLQDVVNDMMESDMNLITKDVYFKDGGYKIMSYFE